MTTRKTASPGRMRANQTWQGPSGQLWLVIAVTTDGMAHLRAATGRMRTIVMPAVPSAKWQRVQSPAGSAS